MSDWVYPDSFNTIGVAADWIAVAGTAFCGFLLLSWIFLPVEKTHRHYFSICLTVAILIMSASRPFRIARHCKAFMKC